MITVQLTKEQLALLVDACDSHVYWQLADGDYRSNGFVEEPGSDDPDTAEEIAAVNQLHDMLEALL